MKETMGNGAVPYRRNFVLLLSGRFVSNIMTVMFNFAQSLYVLDLTGSATAFSAVLIAAILPRALLNFPAGIFVDRSDPKKTIVGADLFAGFLVFAFMALFMRNRESVAVFIGLTLLLNGTNSVFSLAVQAATPRIVGADLVLKANAAQQVMRAGNNILGPVLGAFAYAHLDMAHVFLLNGISFLVSAAGETLIHLTPASRSRASASIRHNFLVVRDYLREEKTLRSLFLFAMAMQMLFEPMTTLALPFITYNVLRVTEYQLSLIQAVSAAGVILGSALAFRKSPEKILRHFFSLLIIQGLLFAAWSFPVLHERAALTPWLLTAGFVFLQFLGRLLNTLQNVPLFSHFQVMIPEEIRGRVLGLFFSVLMLAVPFSLWLSGLILKSVSWAWLPVGAGFLVVVTSLIAGSFPQLRTFFLPAPKPD